VKLLEFVFFGRFHKNPNLKFHEVMQTHYQFSVKVKNISHCDKYIHEQ